MDTPERFTHQVDQYDAWQRETIRRHGWALQAVLGDEDAPPFVYTVGLSGFDHPELIVFATAQATAATVLNYLGELVRAGHVLAARDPSRRGAVRCSWWRSPSRPPGCWRPTRCTDRRAGHRFPLCW